MLEPGSTKKRLTGKTARVPLLLKLRMVTYDVFIYLTAVYSRDDIDAAKKQALIAITGQYTFPYIFIGGKNRGGYDCKNTTTSMPFE